MREGSLPALTTFKETIDSVGIDSLEHLVAPLPSGLEMLIQIA
jgi:hypothetical protein